MSKFTPGKWWIAPPIFDGDAIFAPAQEKGRRNEVVAIGILNKADARLIVAAPNMYELLRMAMWSLRHHSDNDGIIAYRIGELLACIDGDSDVEKKESEP